MADILWQYAEGARTQELFVGCSTEQQEWPSSVA